jgi:hypothetical protein
MSCGTCVCEYRLTVKVPMSLHMVSFHIVDLSPPQSPLRDETKGLEMLHSLSDIYTVKS